MSSSSTAVTVASPKSVIEIVSELVFVDRVYDLSAAKAALACSLQQPKSNQKDSHLSLSKEEQAPIPSHSFPASVKLLNFLRSEVSKWNTLLRVEDGKRKANLKGPNEPAQMKLWRFRQQFVALRNCTDNTVVLTQEADRGLLDSLFPNTVQPHNSFLPSTRQYVFADRSYKQDSKIKTKNDGPCIIWNPKHWSSSQMAYNFMCKTQGPAVDDVRNGAAALLTHRETGITILFISMHADGCMDVELKSGSNGPVDTKIADPRLPPNHTKSFDTKCSDTRVCQTMEVVTAALTTFAGRYDFVIVGGDTNETQLSEFDVPSKFALLDAALAVVGLLPTPMPTYVDPVSQHTVLVPTAIYGALDRFYSTVPSLQQTTATVLGHFPPSSKSRLYEGPTAPYENRQAPGASDHAVVEATYWLSLKSGESTASAPPASGDEFDGVDIGTIMQLERPKQ